MQYTDKKISRGKRIYFAEDLDITKLEIVKEQFEQLLSEKIDSAEALIDLMKKSGELHDILDEETAWRYINMTRFADNEKYSRDFNDFYSGIILKTNEYDFKFARKIYESPFRKALGPDFDLLNRIVSNEIELYRKENTPLQGQEMQLVSKYDAMFSQLTVKYDGKEQTLSQLQSYLENPDKNVRKDAWTLRSERLFTEKERFNRLFDNLKEIRIQQAKNCDFDNYRDYMHQVKGRFSYTPQDLMEFHKAVETEVLPLLRELNEQRRQKLGIEALRPWDMQVQTDGIALKPFKDADELLDKSIDILHKIRPEFGIRLNMMKNSGLLDLENRKGKAPGGYNYPLLETGAPFIFMNAVGIHSDVVTLMHESGHAMHTFAMKDIRLDPYKNTPSEVAELSSMSMELITMDKWTRFYPDEKAFKKAKRKQLYRTISLLPWCMIVDAFQHWIYTSPNHTTEQREAFFSSLIDRFNTGIDWNGLQDHKNNLWQFQLHIFKVPFYYIEYAMSQLGALAIYRNYKRFGKEKTLRDYENFLSLGYTRPVSELYGAAGIEFDFSAGYIKGLIDFVREELNEINGDLDKI